MILFALKGGLARIWRLAAKCPLCALCAALALFSAYCWHGWNKSDARRKADAVAFQQASDQARQAQAELHAKERLVYQEKAHDADQRYLSRASDARSATRDFVARNRVQPNRCVGSAQPLGQASAAAVPAPMPTHVIVDQADVHACGDLYAYAVSAHEWANSLKD